MKKLLFSLALLIGLAALSQVPSRYRNVALDSAAQKVNLGFTQVTNINIAYPSTTIVYIKFYDSYAHAYAKAQSPVWTVQVGTDATLSYSLKSFNALAFKNGLWIRCVTSILDTAQTAVEPATKPLIEITY